MKKALAVLICVLVLLPCCVSLASAKKETEKETEIEFTLDYNQRYTDIIEVSDGDILNSVADYNKENKESKRIVYIAVLVSALVVSVVILIVTLKRVPEEKDVDISGTGKKRVEKDKEKDQDSNKEE